MGSGDSGLQLREVAERLDDDEVDAAVAQPAQLLGEDLLRLCLRHGAERLEQLAGRAEAAGDQGAVLVGDGPGEGGGGLVELVHAVVEPLQPQPGATAAERVGGEDAGAGRGVLLVGGPHPVGVLDVPQLAGATVGQPAVLQQRAHASVEEHELVAELVLQQRPEPVHGAIVRPTGA